ncbi:MAG: hypothetical protein ABRQ37_17360, partial [Candidatus Eremiobacterota bacterium]
GNKIKLTVETLHRDDFNSWKVSGAGTMVIETVYRGDFNQWNIEDNMDKNFDDNLKISVIFPCIISAVINSNSLLF